MSRFTKIACLVMALCLLCGCLAFVVSAESDKVAKVIKADGTETEYTTYAEAANAFTDGDTIVLLKDAVASVRGVDAGKTLTVDLNGFTLDGSACASFMFNVTGTLNIVGDGTIILPNTSGKGLALIQADRPNAAVNVKGDKLINFVGSANSSTFVYAEDGVINIENANVTMGNGKAVNVFVASKTGVVNANNVDAFVDTGSIVKLMGNGAFHGSYCDFVNGEFTNPVNVDKIYNTIVLVESVAATEKVTATLDHCTAVANSSIYKKSQLFLLNNANGLFSIADMTFDNCQFYSAWRVVVGKHDSEDKDLNHRKGTIVFNNCDIVAGKQTKTTTDIGDDHSIVRGNNPIIFNNCYISKSTGTSGFFDATKLAEGQEKSITIGEGNYLSCSKDHLEQNCKYASDEISAHDLSANGGILNLFVGKTCPTIETGFKKQYSMDYEGLYVNIQSVSSTAASINPTQFGFHSSGVMARGGTWQTRTNPYDANSYFHFESVSGKYNSDPYLTLGGSWTLADTSYVVFEFDLMTETFLPPTNIYFNYRYKNSTGGDVNGDSGDSKLAVTYDATTGKNKLMIDGTTITEYNVPTGEWAHFTSVTKITKADDITYNTVQLIYLDGQLIASSTKRPIKIEAGSTEHYISQFRYHLGKDDDLPEASFNLDNLKIKQYGTDYNGSITSMFGTDYAQTLPNDAGFGYFNERPLGNVVASVGGEFYDNVSDAIAAANGETVTLLNDVESLVNISEPAVIDTNGYSIKFTTSAVATEMYYLVNVNENVLTFAKTPTPPAAVSQVARFNCVPGSTQVADIDAGIYPIGTEVIYRGTKLQQRILTDKGEIMEFVGWSTTEGGEAVTLGTVTQSGIVNYYAVYTNIGQALYSVTVGDKVYTGTNYTELKSDLFKAAEGETLNVKLYGDVIEDSMEFGTLLTNVTYNFDLNGHKLIAHSKLSPFTTGTGTVLNLYSSVAGGGCYIKNKNVNVSGGKEYFDSGACLIANNGNGAVVNVGAKDGQYGENMYFAGACLVDASSTSVTNVDGGTYVRNVADYSGFLIVRAGNSISVKNATLINPHSTSVWFNLPGTNGTITVDNCTIAGKSTTEAAGLVSSVATGATITFTNTVMYNTGSNSKAGVTYGEGCKSFSNMANVASGYKVIPVDQHQTVTLKYNTFGDQQDFATNGYSYEITEHEVKVQLYYAIVPNDYVVPAVEGMLYNLTLYSDFQLNLYMPKSATATVTKVRNAVTGGNLLGDNYEKTTVVIDGVEYYVFSLLANVNETDKNLQFRFTLNDAYKSVYALNLTVGGYIETVLKSQQSAAAKQLMMAAADYVNEACKLVDGVENAKMAAILANTDYAQYVPEANTDYGTAADLTAVSAAIYSAQMVLDADPHFLFTVQKGFAGKVTVEYTLDGQTKTVELDVTAVAEDGEVFTLIFDKLRMYQLNDSFTIKAVGTVGETEVNASATYSLGSYIQGLESQSTDATFAKALSTFAKAALAYKQA